MIKIYCLVDPITHKPFYVGATRRSLKDRLYSHIVGRFDPSYIKSLSSRRNKLIREIIEAGQTPLIYCLIIVPSDICDLFEREYYNLFLSQGIELLQHKHRFTYQQHYCKK